MKFKILKPTGSDSGVYTGMMNIQWESVVEGIYINDKKKGILVKGKEFIAIGGLPTAFKEDVDYIWGTFEEVE